MNSGEQKKFCFVICPLDESGSEIRRRSNFVLKAIIKPICENYGYKVTRADSIPEPGLIGNQIINNCTSADLVIADLTDANPNVYYELALAHMSRIPVISFIQEGEKIPFDNNQIRTIYYDLRDYDKIEFAKETLSEQVKAINQQGYTVSNPVTFALGYKDLKNTADPKDKLLADAISAIAATSTKVDNLELEVLQLRRANLNKYVSDFKLSDLAKYVAPSEDDLKLSKLYVDSTKVKADIDKMLSSHFLVEED